MFSSFRSDKPVGQLQESCRRIIGLVRVSYKEISIEGGRRGRGQKAEIPKPPWHMIVYLRSVRATTNAGQTTLSYSPLSSFPLATTTTNGLSRIGTWTILFLAACILTMDNLVPARRLESRLGLDGFKSKGEVLKSTTNYRGSYTFIGDILCSECSHSNGEWLS